jgi:hypothetical protein
VARCRGRGEDDCTAAESLGGLLQALVAAVVLAR